MDKALSSLLAWWDSAGVDVPEVKLVRNAPKQRARQAAKRQAAPPTKPQADQPEPPKAAAPPPASIELARSAKSLGDLQNILSDFNAGDISDHARQAVFSRGNPNADIMVIGEYPSRDEDIQGKLFVGPSGQLMDKVFAAIGLTEDHLYMTHVVNWRPPRNRPPNREDIDICLPFLMRHIELAAPKFIVLVGGIALSALTDDTSIMKARGQWTTLAIAGTDIPALPIYHPEFLLSQPALKKDVWRDILSLRERLGSPQ